MNSWFRGAIEPNVEAMQKCEGGGVEYKMIYEDTVGDEAATIVIIDGLLGSRHPRRYHACLSELRLVLSGRSRELWEVPAI